MALNTLYQVAPDGQLKAFVLTAATELAEKGEYQLEMPTEPGSLDASGVFQTTGDYIPLISTLGINDYYRSPTLVIPTDYYTRVRWSREYFLQDAWINGFVNRDVAQAIKPMEFQFPEDKEPDIKEVLEAWRKIVNRDIGHDGGLDEYNRSLALSMILDGLVITLANWGTIMVNGKPYQVPRVLVDLDSLHIVPDFDSLTGQRVYYLKLSSSQFQGIKDGTATGILQIIPDAADRIVANLDFLIYKLRGLEFDPTFINSGPFLKLPADKIYSINYRGRHIERWPVPSLTSIFSAIAMKRKLQLADFAVADGMINMLMIWSFPIGTKPSDAKKVIDKFITGGRVQSHSVPEGVKLEIVTPPRDVLTSAEKFWIPVSEILVHFDYPLNSRSRGAGDLDSGPLDLATNKARLDVMRDYVVRQNNFYLEQMAERNGWDFEVTALLPRTDLADTDAFRAFIQGLFDRGDISIETLLDAAGTTIEREAARRKREKAQGLDEIFTLRPTFSQTTAVPGDGRPPQGGGLPSSSPAAPTTPSPSRQTRTSKDRPPSSSPGNTTKPGAT